VGLTEKRKETYQRRSIPYLSSRIIEWCMIPGEGLIEKEVVEMKEGNEGW